MRVAIFGASGTTGRLLTRDILDAGHEAVAITRHPAMYPLSAAQLIVMGADATHAADVTRVLHGADAPFLL
jgi:putative NADH-flavin reductase